MKVGVDAINLAADRRGMGRVVRQTLADLQRLGADVTLIVRRSADAGALREFDLRVCSIAQLRAARLERVWYPWNGMRFDPRGSSVVTLHDPFAFTLARRHPIARMREQRPILRAVRHADRLLAVSRWTADEYRRLFDLPELRIDVVPNAISTFWHPVAAPERLPYILLLGATDARKNVGFLLRAFTRAFDARANIQLVVAGELSPREETLARRLGDRVEREHPDDSQLRVLYTGALAFALPSTAEGFGLPALEAMACGAPVLASNAGALPEVCGDAAVLLPCDDVHAWAGALQRVEHDDALREELRARGFARASRAINDRLARELLRR